MAIAAAALTAMALCVWSAFDRNFDIAPSTAGRSIDPALAGPKLAHLRARQEMAAGRPQQALGWATIAVRRDPTNPVATSLLGATFLAMDELDAADAAFRVASAGGWRDIPTQLYWLSQSIELGDFDTASMRIDALLRQSVPMPVLREMFVEAEQTSEGRAAIARRLAQSPFQAGTYAEDLLNLTGEALDNRLDVLERLAAKKVPLDARVLAMAVEHLLVRESSERAAALWLQFGKQAVDPRKTLNNGTFERELAEAGPFDWRSMTSGVLQFKLADAPAPLRGKALEVVSTSSFREPVVMQSLLLPPGRYRLEWQSAEADRRPSPRVRVQVTCKDGTAIVEGRDGPTEAEIFVIPHEACAGQTLAVWVDSLASRAPEPVWIDDIRIAPVRATAD